MILDEVISAPLTETLSLLSIPGPFWCAQITLVAPPNESLKKTEFCEGQNSGRILGYWAISFKLVTFCSTVKS